MMPERIGTSGYSYPWNLGKPTPFRWYVDQGFNSVEINASFYRFANESWIRIWQNAPEGFTFSIKVHRAITHYSRFKGDTMKHWKRFMEPFKCIENKIDFWLFQMPSSFKYNQENLDALKAFFETTKLENKAVLEFRNSAWWKAIKEVADMGVAFCSVSAPNLPRDIVATNNVVYLRLHGAREWYTYVYSRKELDEILFKVKRLKADKKAIYLNNDIGMLENGLYLLRHS